MSYVLASSSLDLLYDVMLELQKTVDVTMCYVWAVWFNLAVTFTVCACGMYEIVYRNNVCVCVYVCVCVHACIG